MRARSIAGGAYLGGWVLDGYDALLVVPIMPLLGRLFFPRPPTRCWAAYPRSLPRWWVGPWRAVMGGYVGGDRFGEAGRPPGHCYWVQLLRAGLGINAHVCLHGSSRARVVPIIEVPAGSVPGSEFGPGTAMIMEWSKWRSEFASAFTQSGYPIGVIMATLVNAASPQ